ncbi:MAG: DUF6850 family outer membrane beta-barrel protein [Bacteroidota bacterium]
MRRIVFIGILLGCSLQMAAQAQGTGCSTLLDEELWLSGNLYTRTCNASGLSLDSIPELRHFEFFYSHRQGSFNRAAEADTSDFLGFRTLGFRKLKKVILAGSFDYDRTYDKNVEWYMRFDPSESNSFYFADSIGGDWLKDRFRTVFSIASAQSWHGFLAGVKTEYHVGLGGRDNDPRPQSLWMNLRVYPSLTWNSGGGWFAGLTGIAGTKREDIDVMNRYGIGGNTIFKINGLMLYGQPLVKNSLSYRYDALQAGFAFQTGYNDCATRWIVELQYLNTFESAVQSPYAADMNEETYDFTSTAIHDADFLENDLKAYTSLKLTGNDRILLSDLSLNSSVSKSYIIDNEQVEFTSRNLALRWSADLFFGQPGELRSGLGLELSYGHFVSLNYFYAEQTIARAGGEIHFHCNRSLGKGWSLGLMLSSGGYLDAGSDLAIEPETPYFPETTAITDPLVRHDFTVLSSNYLSEASHLTLYFPRGLNQRLYLKGSGRILIPGGDQGKLWELNASLGMLF